MHILQGLKNRKGILAMIALVISFALGEKAVAGEQVFLEAMEPQKLELVMGKSLILKSALPVKRVSVAAPKIADFTLLSPYEIYLTGKAPGMTSLTLWQEQKIVAIYDLEVVYDISRLKQKLHDLLPEEEEIQVLSTHDSITLSGRVSSTTNLTQALAVTEGYAPKGKVRNLLEVAGIHQVMLEVRIAEMDRSLAKRLGVNFNYLRGQDFGISLLGSLTNLGDSSGGAVDILVSPVVNALFRFQSGSATWTGFIDALKENGLVKVLAEPTLIALSGQTANFLGGGEFPVPVPQGLGTVAIEYKAFGVGLAFTPTVLEGNKININVAPEVSELDFSTAITFGGFVVPGLTTRRAATTVELADGQSFAIAGLLRDTVRDSLSKYPLLGDLPVLGALFRSRSFQRNETELIIIVTPHLVKPLDMAQQTLPTDYYAEPDTWEFYGLGLMEARELEGKSPGPKGELEGEFGHALPMP